jgi:hypothetical protein
MKLSQNILDRLNSGEQVDVYVTYTDNTREKRRLFKSYVGGICMFHKGSKISGMLLNDNVTSDIKSIVEVKTKTDLEKVRFFLNKTIKLLNQSGLWSKRKEDFIKLNNQSDEWLEKYIHSDWDIQDTMNKEIGISRWVDNLLTSAKIGVVSITYNKYEKEQIIKDFSEAIKNKTSYDNCWRYGYDCSVSCRQNSEEMCAWYSKEYRDCGNGHYYYAIDASHAIFGEDD